VQMQHADHVGSFGRHEQLTDWFETGLENGQFNVPNGRHIVLNEFPRMMKLSRLQLSAGVDAARLRAFLLELNPTVTTSSSVPRVEKNFDEAGERIPRLCKLVVTVSPKRTLKQWYVYTPPLEAMRQGWRTTRLYAMSA